MFVDISVVTISKITLTGCSTHDENSFHHAVCLFRCRDITIANVSITRNKAIELSILDHQGGIINISHCNFTENGITATDRVLGGGGIYIGKLQNLLPFPSSYFFLFAKNITYRVYYTTLL